MFPPLANSHRPPGVGLTRLPPPSRRAVAPLLEHPRVAVGIRKVGETGVIATLRIQPRAPPTSPRFEGGLVPDRADCDAVGDQFRQLGRKVGCDEVAETANKHRLRVPDSLTSPRVRRRIAPAVAGSLLPALAFSHVVGVFRAPRE